MSTFFAVDDVLLNMWLCFKTLLINSSEVKQKPDIGEEKLKYLQSLLIGKCGGYAQMKVNKLLESKKLKGVFNLFDLM